MSSRAVSDRLPLRAKGRREVGTVGRLRVVPCGRDGGAARAVSLLLGEANRVGLTDKQQGATSRPAASRARAAPVRAARSAARQAAGGRRAATAADPLKHRNDGVGSSPRLDVALVFLLIDGVSVVEDLARDLPVVMLGMLSSIGGVERAPRIWSLIAGRPDGRLRSTP